MGVNKNTINSYRQMATMPNIPFMIGFCDQFEFIIPWFCYGKGEPFPGARQQFPEICGAQIEEKIREDNNLTGRKDSVPYDIIAKTITTEEMALIRTLRRAGPEYSRMVYFAAAEHVRFMIEDRKLEVKNKLEATKDIDTLATSSIKRG